MLLYIDVVCQNKFSWELFFKRQECLAIILHIYSETIRATCCHFKHQTYLKTNNMFVIIIIKNKEGNVSSQKWKDFFRRLFLLLYVSISKISFDILYLHYLPSSSIVEVLYGLN